MLGVVVMRSMLQIYNVRGCGVLGWIGVCKGGCCMWDVTSCSSEDVI